MNIFKSPVFIERILFIILVFFMALGGFFHEYFKNAVNDIALLLIIFIYLVLCFVIYRWTLKFVLSRIAK